MRAGSDPYNRLYERMLGVHNHFRSSYAWLQSFLPRSATFNKRELGIYLTRAGDLCHHLESHHNVEESYVFPLLAKRMPAFAAGDAHTKEHEVMHAALELLEAYSKQCLRALSSSQGKKAIENGAGEAGKTWPKEVYDPEKMSILLLTLARALFPHLEAEEESIKGANMRKAGWTEAELRTLPN